MAAEEGEERGFLFRGHVQVDEKLFLELPSVIGQGKLLDAAGQVCADIGPLGRQGVAVRYFKPVLGKTHEAGEHAPLLLDEPKRSQTFNFGRDTIRATICGALSSVGGQTRPNRYERLGWVACDFSHYHFKNVVLVEVDMLL